MAYYFHRATSVAMPANLLILPLLQLLMPAAVLAIAASYISFTLAKLPAAIAGLALEGIAGTVKSLGGLRLADVRVPTPALSAIVFSGLAIVICAALMRRRPWLAVTGGGLLAASAFCIWTILPRPQIRPGVLEMTAIDVGQGDSILLVTPESRTCCWMQADFRSGRTPNSTSAKTSSRRIYGAGGFRESARSL